MKKYFIYILLIGFCIIHGSCKAKLKNDEDKLVEMIADFHIAKAALERFPPHERDSIYQVFTDQIFEIHSISKNSFDLDIRYLEKHPEHYQKVLDKVTSLLLDGMTPGSAQR